MTYKEMLEKSPAQLVKEYTDKGVDYSKAVVVIKLAIQKARKEALNEKNYHEMNLQAWGESDGTASLKEEYGSYDNLKAEYNAASKADKNLAELGNQVCEDYIHNRTQLVYEFPKKSIRESNTEYSQKLNVYKQNVQEILEDTDKYLVNIEKLDEFLKCGYDSESPYTRSEWEEQTEILMGIFNSLPYNDSEDVARLKKECEKGLQKAEEKLAELAGTFGN